MSIQKRILVTGGAGFLGSHLCERIIHRKDKIICVDNFYTGAAANIQHLANNANFSFINHDVVKPLEIDGEIDEICNFACPASPPKYQKDPIYTMKINLFGALNLLDLAVKKNAKFIQASTSEVYGDPSIHPQTEAYCGNVNPIGIRACYDEGKRSVETLCFDYLRCRNVNIRVARIFNTYGPRMLPDDGRVVSNFIMQALRGEGITIYGDGSQTRSFCYVDDLIAGVLRLMDADDKVSSPVNIGNPAEYTIKELAETILELTGSDAKMIYLPLPQDDPTQRCPDISHAEDKLNWRPKIALREGLRKTIDYFKSVQQAETNLVAAV